MSGKIRRSVVAVAVGAVMAISGVVTALPASAADHTFSCSIGVPGWYSCASDNYNVAPGQQVSIALNTSGGKGVWFAVKNLKGNHLLSSPGVKQSPNGSFYYYWTNNTSSNITIDIQADADAIVNVYAVATLRIQ